jgi:23S rRNA (guanosine2251-2'-O)-methyltransferase
VELLLARYPRLIKALHLLAAGDASLERLRVEARKAGIRVIPSDRETLTALARTEEHQGVVAESKEPASVGLEAWLGKPAGPGTMALALDHIQDPRNVGAILRSAACFGVAGVIYPSRRASPITETVVKTSAGGAYAVPLIEVPNLAGAVRALKKEGWWIAGAAVGEGRAPSADVLPKAPLLLVLGSEGTGIRPVVDDLLDDRFTIPQPGEPLSLNVSVAAGILLYALTRGG